MFRMRRALIASCLATLPGAALAHSGHDAGTFVAGISHPVSGADHVLAMVAVGLWAAQAGGRALWAAPLTFVAAMLAGGFAGAAGMPFPAVEPVILASIVILGAAVAMALRAPLPAALPVLAVFGAAHGWAHGAEGPATGLVAYAAGFALVTAALHVLGIGLGLALGRLAGGRATRALGAVTAAAGVALVAGG